MNSYPQMDKVTSEDADAEDAFRNHEENGTLAPLLEGIPGFATFMLDIHGQVISWNMGAQHLTGYVEQEILSQPFSCFYTREDVKTSPSFELANAIRRNFFEKEHWIVKKDGSRFWSHIYILNIRNLENYSGTSGFVVMLWDLTMLRSTELTFKPSKGSLLDEY
jgi:PAS domain S-box-containing protein